MIINQTRKKSWRIKTSTELFSFPHTKAFLFYFAAQQRRYLRQQVVVIWVELDFVCLRAYTRFSRKNLILVVWSVSESHTELLRMEWFIRLLASLLFSPCRATPLTPTPTPPHSIHRLYIYGKSTKMRSAHSHHHPHSACYQKENTRFFVIIQFSFFHAKKSQNFCVIFTCWKSRSWFHQFILCLSAVLSYKLFDIT